MQAFTATLALDATLLRGLRHSLASWLDRAGAELDDLNAMLLATHEAAAHAMQTGEAGSTVDVTANRNGDGSYSVHVRSAGSWTTIGSEATRPLSLITELMSEVSTQSSTTLRMRRDAS